MNAICDVQVFSIFEIIRLNPCHRIQDICFDLKNNNDGRVTLIYLNAIYTYPDERVYVLSRTIMDGMIDT